MLSHLWWFCTGYDHIEIVHCLQGEPCKSAISQHGQNIRNIDDNEITVIGIGLSVW